MSGNGEIIGLNEITITDPIIAEQNELIAQLAQQIAEMRVEMHKTRELANLNITANTPLPNNERPPLHFPTPNPTPEHFPHNPPIILVQKPPTIKLNTTNQHHASSSYQTPHPSQSLNSKNSQAFPSMYETPPQNTSNPPTTQPLPTKATFHIPILTEPHLPYTTYPEPDHYKEKEKEWRVKEEMNKKSMKEDIMKAMKELHYTLDVIGLNYENLCIHPNLDLPEGFKVPKFDTFGGTRNPLVHLRAYCHQLIGVGKNEALLMQIFS